MPTVDISFDFSDTKRLRRRINLAKDFADDLSPVWDACADAMAKGFEQTFNREGPGWEQLADFTVALRTSRIERGFLPSHIRPEHPILEQTGDLKRSLTNRANPLHFERITKTALGFGSFVPYALLHEEGGTNDAGHRVPRREIIDVDLQFDLITRAFADAASVEVRQAFRGV